MKEPIQLLNSFTWFRGHETQKEAIEWLESRLTQEQREEFGRRYRNQAVAMATRSATPPHIQLELNWTGQYDSRGFRIFQLALSNAGEIVDSISVLSGAGYTQQESFIRPENDWSGSGRCLPEGIYAIGPVEDSQLIRSTTSWGEGLGRYWMSLDILPQYQANNRSAFGIHADANAAYSPGSAGCVCPLEPDGLQRILGWMNAKARPIQLVSNLETGFLQERGYQPPIAVTPVKPEPIVEMKPETTVDVYSKADHNNLEAKQLQAAELLGIDPRALEAILTIIQTSRTNPSLSV